MGCEHDLITMANRDECFFFQSDSLYMVVHILTYSMYKKSNIKKENRNENGMKRDENGM